MSRPGCVSGKAISVATTLYQKIDNLQAETPVQRKAHKNESLYVTWP